MHSILHDLPIKAPPSTVFDAITQPAHLNNWWPLRSSGAPELGATYNFYFSPQYDWYGIVTACMLNQLFTVQMTKADEDWDPTYISFEIEPQTDGILLHFSHSNWQATNAHFRRTSFCWAILLQGLKNYLEKGVIIPFTERE
ncbi:MAG: SRPBCC domain-containing protein [Bacteroidota bacterium]